MLDSRLVHFHLRSIEPFVADPKSIVDPTGEMMWGERTNNEDTQGEARRFRYIFKYWFN